MVVNLPYLEPDRTPAAPPALLRALPSLLDSDTAFLDLAPVVRDYYRDPRRPSLRFARDRHPNREAHRLFASAIEAFLDARGLLAGKPPPPSTGGR